MRAMVRDVLELASSLGYLDEISEGFLQQPDAVDPSWRAVLAEAAPPADGNGRAVQRGEAPPPDGNGRAAWRVKTPVDGDGRRATPAAPAPPGVDGPGRGNGHPSNGRAASVVAELQR